MKQTMVNVGAFLGVALPLAGIVWWTAEHEAQAEDEREEQAQIVETLDTLKAIHVRQETVDDAKREQLKELCDAGKLAPEDCR